MMDLSLLQISRRKKGRRQAGSIILGAAIMLALLAAFLIWHSRKGSVKIYPQQEAELPDMIYFLQADSEWAEDHLGGAGDTMASSGCLVSSLAAGLDMQAKELGLDFYMTAGELNEVFSREQVYTDSGAVIWGQIPSAVAGTECYVAERVKAEEIDRLLSQGIYPVVKVRVAGVGAYHWVLVTGTGEEGYLCMDPMCESREPVWLSQFGNRVYSMRAVYFSSMEI